MKTEKFLPQEIYLYMYLFVHILLNSAVRNSNWVVLKDWTVGSNNFDGVFHDSISECIQ
jgi:hypothetical protein